MKVFDFLSDDDISGDSVVLDEQLLPLVHTTPCGRSMSILRQMKLEKEPCKKFTGEHLLYFFYAIPAKRTDKSNTLSDKEILPVVFIVKPILNEIKRIYPFDSGAFDMYKQKKYLSETAEISDYELPNTFLAIQQYIKAVFGSNHNYYFGNCKVDSELPNSIAQRHKTNYDLDNLLKLISNMGNDGLDDRCRTIEIQCSNDYDLAGKLLAVIFPTVLYNNPELVGIIKMSGARPFNYTYHKHHKVNECISIVYNHVEKYYAEQGYIASENNYES
jgi:hypothetical protein